jgi:DNA-binding MarR family transcriptional regulator
MVRPYGSPARADLAGPVAVRYGRSTNGGAGCVVINTESERPIGYWLKKLDRLIEQQFELQLSTARLSRRQWQLLNLLDNNPRSVPELQTELHSFLRDTAEDLSDALAGLVTRGWAESTDNIVNLTETGQAQFEIVEATVAGLRQGLMMGISAEEYRATIGVLARMAANLERTGNEDG